jgi:2-methylisocitrate lyase-like PEP mutase family enzyme
MICHECGAKRKGARFRVLHDRPGAFVIPNHWDVASSRILAGSGFEALATSSAASACALGKKDGSLTRDEALTHARTIVNATDLPVSADLAGGFGDTPEIVAETIRLAANVGLVGCTIEDITGDPDRPLFRGLSFPFLLTARAHNLMYANPSLDATIERLHAFEQAGADVLFAPGLPDLNAVRAVCTALSKPVNFMAGIKGKSFSVTELAAAGVKRISLATSLYRAAMTGFLDAVNEVTSSGRFLFLIGISLTRAGNRATRWLCIRLAPAIPYWCERSRIPRLQHLFSAPMRLEPDIPA